MSASSIPEGTLSEKEKDKFRMAFKVVSGENREIEVDELRQMLNSIFKGEVQFGGFGREVCRSIIALYDTNLNGMLGFEEALEFWGRLRLWTKAFKQFDTDGNGYFLSHEWNDLLNALGHDLGPMLSKALHARYSDRKGHVHFNSYIACMLKLTAMIAAFVKRQSLQGDDDVTFKLDEFIQLTLYA